MSACDSGIPKTVDQAVDRLLSDISLNNEIQVSLMKEECLTDLHFFLAHYIRNEFGLWNGNQSLRESCRSLSGKPDIHVDDASMIITKALWELLKEKNVLKD